MNNVKGQQKIYVDIEEEITTVVEHLRHVRVNDVILVVPQHALLLQSVVNLKLLAQEARKLQKSIIIMTKDVDGVAFAQRAGIVTQPYVADEEEYVQEEIVRSPQPQPQQRNNAVASAAVFAQNYDDTQKKPLPQNRNVGGIQQRPYNAAQSAVVQKKVPPQRANVQNNHSDNGIAQYEKSLEDARVVRASQYAQPQKLQQDQRTVGTVVHPTQQKESFTQPIMYQKAPSRVKNKQNKKQKKKIDHVSSGASFAMRSFIFSGIVLIFIVLLVAIFPKTTINVTPKNINIDERMEMTARTDQSVYDEDRRLIPARLIERDITFTKTFPATGSGDVNAQKAQGTIVIYNEYNEKSQPLVATTRFLSEDGVLFRLVKQTTVPGMKDGEPGKVEALVIADEEGVSGNVGPTRFSVPGFEGSPKKDKFYGVSEKSMVGGGSGGSGVALVTQSDIDTAEKKMNEEVNVYIEEQVNGMLRPDSEVLLSDAMTSEMLRSEASLSDGTMGDDFMYEIVSHVKALVFAQGDVLAVMESGVNDDMQQYDVEQMKLVLSYNAVEVDFENESLKMTVQGTADIVVVVDLESFKKNILGEKHDDLLGIIENEHGNEIEKITIESVVPGFPAFIANRVSRLGFMTDIFIAQ